MSYCKDDGKDKVYFITAEDAAALEKTPAPIDLSTLDDDDDGEGMRGAIKPNGEIDWDCPCLKPMLKPPCGDTFKEAFSCFVHSKEEPKGADCIGQFRAMQACFAEHPDIYGPQGEDDDDDDLDEGVVGESASAPVAAPASESTGGDAPVSQPAAAATQ